MKVSAILLVLLLNAAHLAAQSPAEYRGRLYGLAPDRAHIYQRVFETVPSTGKTPTFSPPLDKGTAAIAGDLIDDRSVDGTKLKAVILESPGKPPRLAVDLNADGTIVEKERLPFTPAGEGDFDITLTLPIKNPLFAAFPVFVRYKSTFTHPKLKPTDRLVLQTVWAHALAQVEIGGRRVQFLYSFDPKLLTISTRKGLFGVDADGDGGIRNEQFSVETSYAEDGEVVMRIGDLYVSTAKIDPATGEVTVRRREKREYLRHELEVGKEMPDFDFVDFAGKLRKLSEFRGKYVLVDFWGVWCADCVRDIPYQLDAYRRFAPLGFEILGLNWDDKMEDAVAFLSKHGATWPQARKESIRRLTEVTYRIQEYPSLILLDREGKVVSLDQDALQGPALANTLARLLPARP